MAGVVVCAAVLLAAAVFGVVHRRADGRVRTGRAAGDGPRLAGADLGGGLGERATLVQFSSAYCAPCRAVRRLLAEVAGEVGGVVHVEVDVEERLELVRRLNVLKTPTVLVLDPLGRVVARAAGTPSKADLLGALEDARTA